MIGARVVIHDRECHLDCPELLVVGDEIPVIRGNGPREGDLMGTAIVIAFDEDGEPELTVRLGGPLDPSAWNWEAER